MTCETKDWFDIIKGSIECTAILIAGIWTIYRFGLAREKYAKIEFDLNCSYLGETDENYIIELLAIVENKGLVRQYIKEWTFDLLLFKDGDIVDETMEKINNQVKFCEKKISRRPWVPTDWFETFIDASTKQVYRYLTSVPKDTKLISLYSRFIYPDSTDDFHSAQKTFNVQHMKRIEDE